MASRMSDSIQWFSSALRLEENLPKEFPILLDPLMQCRLETLQTIKYWRLSIFVSFDKVEMSLKNHKLSVLVWLLTNTLREHQYILPFARRSENSVWLLQWWSFGSINK